MHVQHRSNDPIPVNQETSASESAPSAPADPAASSSGAEPTATWKENWLSQADRRGAIWHVKWKESLLAKRVAKGGGKHKKV